MATRQRSYSVRYGGWKAGSLDGADVSEPAYVGIHACYDELHPGPPYRSGGPLLVSKKKVSLDRTAAFSSRTYFAPVHSWNGHLTADAYVPGVEPTAMNLAGWGSKGWNRAFPTHPIYNLGVSLLEMKDFTRMITQTRDFFNGIRHLSFSRTPKSIGDLFSSLKKGSADAAGDYLNLQFGWVPFVQDIAFLLQMKRKLEQKMAWLKKHNGKSFRRNFEMDRSSFSEGIDRFTYPLATMKPTLSTELYHGYLFDFQNIPIQKTYSRRIWFRSKWRMWIPELADWRADKTHLKFSLVGLDLDPSIVYKATPWSWLLDWFVNVGTILQNIYLRARYHVVAEYAYVMGSENYRYDAPGFVSVNTGQQFINFQTFSLDWPGYQTMSGVSKTYYEFRQRVEANPYGFGITFSSFSAYQWSILVALGLTRGGRSFATRS